MKKFILQYNNETIYVTADRQYHLLFPNGNWILLHPYPDDTKTEPVENENISYSHAFVWVVEDKSPGADWLTAEQLQQLGELARKRYQEMENE